MNKNSTFSDRTKEFGKKLMRVSLGRRGIGLCGEAVLSLFPAGKSGGRCSAGSAWMEAVACRREKPYIVAGDWVGNPDETGWKIFLECSFFCSGV